MRGRRDREEFSYTLPRSILGASGNNSTGVSTGGFEISTDYCLIAGNSVDQSSSGSYSPFGQRNIFLSITNKNLSASKTVWLTEYGVADGITPYTPQRVKLNEEQFLLIWEEYYAAQERMYAVNPYDLDSLNTVVLYGDLDNNGVVNLKDAQAALRAVLKITMQTDKEKKVADVDLDGVVTLADVQRILNTALKITKQP